MGVNRFRFILILIAFFLTRHIQINVLLYLPGANHGNKLDSEEA